MAKTSRVPSKQSLQATISQEEIRTRFENMLTGVADMLDRDGPIISTWIYFQLGLNGKSVIFNSSSTNRKENLIAQLDIEKTNAGIANTFTLTVKYDPFNMGQNPSDEIEILDEFIALAMAEDFKDENSIMRGKVQYGYNTTTETNLVSPFYELYITSASSQVLGDSGITTYTFTGTSILSGDCDFVTSFDGISEPTKLLKIVEETLYKYYGDPQYPPSHISGIQPLENEYKYRIDIPDELYNGCVDVEPSELSSSTSNMMSPFAYCKWLLDEHPLTSKEVASGDFDDLASMSYNKRPRYTIYITDSEPATIRIAHFAPSSQKDDNGVETVSEKSLMKVNYVFSWGKKNKDLKNKNIVISWTPQVDLYTYLIKKALKNRYTNLSKLFQESINNNFPSFIKDSTQLKRVFQKTVESLQDEVMEMYNAELQIIGIPTDVPICAEVEIHPQILETESRTRGIYTITGAADSINNQGVFITTLRLFRLRGTDAVVTDNSLKAISNVINGVGKLLVDATTVNRNTTTNQTKMGATGSQGGSSGGGFR